MPVELPAVSPHVVFAGLLLLHLLERSPPRLPVVGANISTTHATLSREGSSAVHDAPVVDDYGLARTR